MQSANGTTSDCTDRGEGDGPTDQVSPLSVPATLLFNTIIHREDVAAPEDIDGSESEGSTNRSVSSTPNQQTLSQYSDTGTAKLTSVCDVSSGNGSVSPDDTYRDEAWLREQYVEQQKSTLEIADECGVGDSTISRWVGRFEIDTRSQGEAHLVGKSVNIAYQDEEWLREKYIGQELSPAEIADECGVGETTIRRQLDEFEIERQVPGENTYRNESWLREQYVEQQKSALEIADEYGVSNCTIGNWLRKHNIEVRSPSEAHWVGESGDIAYQDEAWLRTQYVEKQRSQTEIANECGVTPSNIGYWLRKFEIERQLPVEDTYRDEVWLREQYIEQGKSPYKIGDECGVSHTTIYYWLRKNNIEIRSGYPDDHLNHEVDSSWELYVADLLHENGVSYQNESMVVTYTTVVDWGRDSKNTHIHYPDFVTEDYVIEVKGCNFGKEYERPGTAERKARAVMNHIDDRKYVVVGIDLPCDHQYSYENREDLLELFE